MTRLKSSFLHAVIGLGVALAPAANAQVAVKLDAANRGPSIGDLHYGIFFEEINHAGDGGLYAELIRNRSFEDSSSAEYWSKVGNASLSIITGSLLNDAQSRALRVTFAAAGDGVSNPGYWGINAVKDRSYDLSFWVRGSYSGTLTASLVTSDGTSLGSVDIPVTATNEWKKVTSTLTATDNDSQASFRLTSSKAGSLDIDVVSLFPPTYKNRPNGCRVDLAEMLEAMHPSFVRFPGGCFVEGSASGGVHNRFEWKKTIGGIEERPGHMNVSWGYRASDGLGFHELLQLTEDLGAEPLFVVNVGMGHNWTVDYLEIDEYIQEALDAIEYCNGDVTTKWGAVRAANGHPEPFNLRLLEIGNENYQANSSQQSDHYAERYRQFYDAIKAKYPEITLIGNVESWGTDTPSWRNTNPVEVVDEHYYRSPSWFQSQYNKYDSYDRSGPKVYAGEYAVTSDFGTTGHLTAALGESIYMLGMENNSDICVMNSYAPIFVNENDERWTPDMIRFTSTEAYGTPSYHVQKLMSEIHGKQNVKWTETGNTNATGHNIGMSTWSTTATFDNVKVTDTNGNVVFYDDFSEANDAWHSNGGTWTVADGILTQSNSSMQGKIYYADVTTPDSYTYEVDATKLSGSEGFLIAFHYGDGNNYCWWNVGGWSNTKHALEYCVDGTKTKYDQLSGSVVTGQTYHVKIVVDGANVKCYLDDSLIHDVTLPVSRNVYLASSLNDDEEMLYLKIVNPNDQAATVTYNLDNASFVSVEDVTVLTSEAGTDENTTDNQQNVYPAHGSMGEVTENTATYEAPAYSLTIIRMKISGANTVAPGDKPSESDEAIVDETLEPVAKKLAFLHASTFLPTQTSNGATIKWSLKGDNSMLSLTESKWATYLNVASPLTNDTAITGSSLVADITYSKGETSQIEIPVTIAPTDDKYGYLYCYMSNSKEITNYALGTKADRGMKFHQLLDGGEIFDTEACATIEKGTRDAYLGRGEGADAYFITTTDMCNANSKVWNNYGIDLIRSTDLIHWEGSSFDFRKGKSIFSDPTATTDAYKTDEEYANINRVWAPQWLWDASANNGEGAYLVYYSILSSNSGDNYDKIYYSYADKDFKTLTQPRLFYDAGYSVIDADIVLNPYDGLYHMAIKHEDVTGSARGIYILTSDTLIGGTWTEVLHMTNDGSAAVEGASLVRLIDEDTYNLYYMRYSDGSAYKMCQLDHLTTNPGSSIAVEGDGSFQHGSFLAVTEDEYNVVQLWSDLTAALATAKALNSPVYDDAIAFVEAALANTTIATLAEELPKAKEALLQAHSEYVKTLLTGEDSSDLTALLVNPDFNSNNGDGWSGTSFTATSAGVAEHYNKNFDTYQILEGMPTGTYTLECSGFYRNGAKSAYNSHVDGTEQLLAKLYLNNDESSFMSLFDDSTSYTYSPYTFPDNVTTANTAFNTDMFYGGNRVSTVLTEVGDLVVGIRKTTAVSTDWTCFDNFKLYYTPDNSSGVETVAAANRVKSPVDVFTITGIRIRHNVELANATADLTPGIYIVGDSKVAVR